MRIAIFPGSFNPPHMGHIYIALDVYYELKLDLVYFVPTGNPVNKQYLKQNSKHRYNMVKIAISNIPFFNISDFEIYRKGISYTYITVKYFKQKFNLNKDNLFLIIGQDWIDKLFKWKSYKFILDNCNLVCMSRNYLKMGSKEEENNETESINIENTNKNMKNFDSKRKKEKKEILILNNKLLKINKNNFSYYFINKVYDISSTEIRKLIKERKYFKPYVPESVYYYIVNNGLFL